jgi:multidrug efflux pump subunit AcrA (membrane-fusion protein)
MREKFMTALLKSKLTWTVVIILAGVGIFFWRNPSAQPAGNIGVVVRGDLVQRVTIAGSVNPNRKTVISAPYNGYVRKIYVEIGDHVKEGQAIVSVAQSLRSTDDEVYPLRAPFAGTVVQVLKTEGEYVDQQNTQGSGDEMVRIDDLTHIFIEASAPEIEFSKLKIGQEGIIKASAVRSRSFKGKIVHISLAAKEQKDWDRSRVEFPVIIAVTDNDGALKPGMSVIVDIITRKVKDVLTLRQEFVQKDKDQYFVIREDGTRKDISIGTQNEESFEIKSGLNEGDRVRQTDYLTASKAH